MRVRIGLAALLTIVLLSQAPAAHGQQEQPRLLGVNVVLLIDSTGSMSQNDPQNMRKEAA